MGFPYEKDIVIDNVTAFLICPNCGASVGTTGDIFLAVEENGEEELVPQKGFVPTALGNDI